ncbi:D-2-hydroxyacid dehydrogenase [Salinisphaera sp. USBA-960]|nr:D-2-hydroxyacid dehydrogenase [Salifodinibacter halophilus]NNC26168.1 D-2-hydroxyacid dehydrogenase [Salifodinibacter halophilus]
MSNSSAPKPTVTVLAGDNDGPPGVERLYDHVDARIVCDEAGLAESLPDSQIVLVTDFRSDALARTWPQAKNVDWVHAASAGVDQLMFDALRTSDVAITNAQGIFDHAIAEYVLGAILFFAKDTRHNVVYQQQKRWVHRDTETIADKRVVVAGAGSIGHEIGALCRAAGMAVDGVASRAREGDDVFGRIHAAAHIDDVLTEADYVVIAAPLTDATRHWFDAARFNAMPPHARLINIGRGPIVVTDDLVDALQNNQIAGAALDVFENEPLPADHPLWSMDNVLLSPHMAGDFVGWREALIDQFLANLDRWQTGQPLFNPVNKKAGYAA